MSTGELVLDLMDDFHDNVDGDPAVDFVTEEACASPCEARIRVRFTDGTAFDLDIREVRQ